MKRLNEIIGDGAMLSFKVNGKVEHPITKALEVLQKEINEPLFDYMYTPINKKMAIGLTRKFIKLGASSREIKCHDEHRKKLQLLLKDIIEDLTAYYENYNEEADDSRQVQTILNYRLKDYLNKKETLSNEMILKMLKINKTIHHCYLKDGRYKVNDEKFLQMQTELIDALTKPYIFK